MRNVRYRQGALAKLVFVEDGRRADSLLNLVRVHKESLLAVNAVPFLPLQPVYLVACQAQFPVG